jgi:uncharacterized membrane protein YagU involved in acid resistance
MLNVVRGAIAGAAGTWLMDRVTQAMLANQPDAITAREEAARPNGQDAVSNLVDRLSAAFDLELAGETRSTATSLIHYGLGVIPGALYAVLRHRIPLLGAGGGLVYGALLWAVNDEYLNASLGLAGPPEAYPAETHLRGLVGHLVLGAVTDSVIDAGGG